MIILSLLSFLDSMDLHLIYLFYEGLAHVSFEQLADVKSKIEGEENDLSAARKISKEQIMRDVKGAVNKLGKDRIRRTKRDMKRDNKYR